ncbi:hypothetical protein EV122DRAFT_273813 [Schizophyllum commune]
MMCPEPLSQGSSPGNCEASAGRKNAAGGSPYPPVAPLVSKKSADALCTLSDSRQCTICKRRFTRVSGLEAHLRTHTREKPYACGALGCDAAFASRSNMLRHRRTHGEAVVAEVKEHEHKAAAAKRPPPPLFDVPIVHEHDSQVTSAGMFEVQRTTTNRATRSYKRHASSNRSRPGERASDAVSTISGSGSANKT